MKDRKPVSFRAQPWKQPEYKDAPKPVWFSERDAARVRDKLKASGRLNDDGTVSLWHVTLGENADSIAKEGLIPARENAGGQDWEAEHAKYATYFHSDKGVAEQNMENADGTAALVEARVPVNALTLSRFLPDEDASDKVEDGVPTLEEGGPVAFVGGVPASAIKVHS